jgi:signal peptidase I
MACGCRDQQKDHPTRPAARRRGRVPLPADPRIDYIKRVVGVPGDEIDYRNQDTCT